MRVALFVEGTLSASAMHHEDALVQIWQVLVPSLSGAVRPNRVIGISKKHIVGLSGGAPIMSGAAEPFDLLLNREHARDPFDAAIVAWDLVPPWNPSVRGCRWQETCEFYANLARRDRVAEPWRTYVRGRAADLASRRRPSTRVAPARLVPGAIVPVCMDPMFEDLLVGSEGAIRRVLGVAGRRVPGWPGDGWAWGETDTPDVSVLQRAILAVRGIRPRPRPVVIVRGDMRTNKHGWAEYILRAMLEEASIVTQLGRHPVIARMREVARPDARQGGRRRPPRPRSGIPRD
jgi:hypothetical protein